MKENIAMIVLFLFQVDSIVHLTMIPHEKTG